MISNQVLMGIIILLAIINLVQFFLLLKKQLKRPWRPRIKRPTARYLYEVYDISEKRQKWLLEEIDRNHLTYQGGSGCWAHLIDHMAVLCETAGEFSFCVAIHSLWLQKNNMIDLNIGK